MTLVRTFLLLISTHTTLSHYGYFYYKYTKFARSQPLPQSWSSDWESVSSVFSPAPSKKLDVRWRNSGLVEAGDTVPVTVMTDKPVGMRWGSEYGALYTVMLLDAGISRVLPKMYVHWMLTNVPGNNIQQGTEVMRYVTPFSLEFTEDGEFITDTVNSSHPLILAVFKQNSGSIIIRDETQAGCTPDIVDNRIVDYKELQSKYDLELVAGNFLYMPYSGYATHDMVCRISKCTGTAWPFPIPGINDLEECQPRTDIMDITTRGPARGKEEQYSKYTSKYSPDSVTHIIQDTAPDLSTGKATEYTALEGAFSGAEIFSNNLASTLDGTWDATFFTYVDLAATEVLFFDWFIAQPTVTPLPDKTPVIQRLAPLFPAMSGNKAFAIVLSRPLDQDFDILNINKEPGWVFDLQIVQVREGMEEEFQELRKKVISLSRNIRDVEDVFTFEVDRDILTDPRGLLREETERYELTIVSYKSRAARQRAIYEAQQFPEFEMLSDTFDCVACALMTENTRPEYYPPFSV